MSFNPREYHHLYTGLILLVIAPFWGGPWLVAPGVLLVVDDVAQHFFGVDPSPVHRFYVRFLWPLPWVQAVNRWLDGLFGRL